MGNESEKALPISDFLGIDRTTNTENVPPGGFYSLQNLYEKEIDTLIKRGGSLSIQSVWPSNVSGINKATKLYYRDLSSARIIGVKCTPPVSCPVPTTAGFTAEVIAGTGYWGASVGGPPAAKTGTLLYGDAKVYLQFVGFGVNFFRKIVVTNYGGANRILRLVVPASVSTGKNITGINVYADTMVEYKASGTTRIYTSPIWVGHIDLIQYPSGGTFNFVMAPRYWDQFNIAPTVIGDSLPTYTLSGTTGGTLTPGKTYYVAVMTGVLSTNYNGTPETGVDFAFWKYNIPYTTSFPSITLKAGETAIKIENIVGTTSCYAVAVGTDPNLMTMQFITNVITSNTIATICKTSPNLVPVIYTATNSIYKFLAPDFSTRDMLIRLENDTFATYPIFVSGLTDLNQMAEEPWGADNAFGTQIPGFYFKEWNNQVSGIDWQIGNGNIIRYTQLNNQVYFVNDSEAILIDDPSLYYIGGVPAVGNGRLVNRINMSGLYATDGYIAGAIVFKYGTTAPPKSKYIITYQESLVMGGGSGISDSYSRFYFSQALSPYDFSQSGGAAIAYVDVGTEGDPLTGFGIYAYTNALQGPLSQLIVGKKNSTWGLTNLPSSWATKTSMICMSQKVGIFGDTIVNTEIGCIFTSRDNVFLFSEAGEPQPIGDAIHNILKEYSPSQMVLSQAVFHDNHYKLTLNTSIGGSDSTELWLDIKKMKALKGKPVWKGPHIGRRIDSSHTEDLVNDTRKRICVDSTTRRVFEADVDGLLQDFSNNITAICETHYHPMAPAIHMKKLYTRCYWKIKTMMPITVTEETLFDDGRLSESQTLTWAPPTEATWSQAVWNNTLFNNAWYKIYASYPKTRLTGITIKKRLTHSGPQNIAISSISPHFKLERRRVT